MISSTISCSLGKVCQLVSGCWLVYMVVLFCWIIDGDAAENYLCDTTILSRIRGDWSFDQTDCSWYSSSWDYQNILWFGDSSGTIPYEKFNSLTSFTMRVNFTITDSCASGSVGNGRIGVYFRARNTSDTGTWRGQQYYFGIHLNDIARIMISNNGGTELYWVSLVNTFNTTFDDSKQYSFTIISKYNHSIKSNTYDFYLDQLKIFENIVLDDYLFGSFALITNLCRTYFNSFFVNGSTD